MFSLTMISSEPAQIITALAIVFFAGCAVSAITSKLHLPNVTGYILAGVLIGPYVLRLVPEDMIHHMDFVTDIALAYIAFGVGKYFRFSELKKNGKQIILITLFEALAAAVVITVTVYFLFHLPLSFSLLLGAIGCATAPASTIMTIRQYHAKGPFVNAILQVVALDDAVALIAFSVCAAFVSASSGGPAGVGSIILPVVINLVSLVFGAVLGFILRKLTARHKAGDYQIIMLTAILLGLTGFCAAFDISPLLACMVVGMVYSNAGGGKKLYKLANKFSPPVLMLFFVLSGMRLNLTTLASAGIIGVVYFFIRIVGKYIGAYSGAAISGAPKEVRNYLGLALIPQAGVSIGLAMLGQRILPADAGALLSTIILSSGVLYEMVGPVCAKASLFLSHSIPDGTKSKLPAEDSPLAEEDEPDSDPVDEPVKDLEPLPVPVKHAAEH